MITRVQKWGNSQGLRFPKHVLEAAGISVGDAVELTSDRDKIVIKKKRKPKFDLDELLSRMPADYEVREESSGKPVGKEEW